MLLTHKIRIFPTHDQEIVLRDLAEKCRLIYNFALEERIEDWKQNKKRSKEERLYISYTEQQNNLPHLKKKYPEYKWVYSKVLQMTLRKLDEAYKSFFTKWKKGDTTTRPPKFKGKKYFTTLCYNQSGFKIEKDKIEFSHKHPSKTLLNFSLKYPFHYENNEIKQVELFLDSQNRWFISINYEHLIPKYRDNGLYQAIDLGISNLVSAVNLDFKFVQVKNRRADLYWRKKIEEVQSKRDHCKKYSHRWYRYTTKLNKMKRKCAHQMRDYQHKISKKIVSNTKANTIIIGDLDVKKMAKRKKGTGSSLKNKMNKTLNHSIQNTGSLGRFAEFLTYKAKLVGKRVIRTDESYTSQDCCLCGKRVKRKISERTINCDCGNRMDRDLNSAVNIMVNLLHNKHEYDFLLHQPSLNEESFLTRLDLLRNTALSPLFTGDRGLVVKAKNL